MSAAKTLALALAALYAAAVFQPVIARDRNTFGVPDIMVSNTPPGRDLLATLRAAANLSVIDHLVGAPRGRDGNVERL